MSKWMLYLAGFVLIAHGLIHLMGTTVYMRLGDIIGFTYKTTLLGGRWDVGSAGISVFGLLWAVAAVGFCRLERRNVNWLELVATRADCCQCFFAGVDRFGLEPRVCGHHREPCDFGAFILVAPLEYLTQSNPRAS